MNFRPLLLLCLLVVCGCAADRPRDKSYDHGYEPRPPERFPKAYKDYQILPGSISPDGKLALIYPRREVVFSLPEGGLYLVKLKPFQILKEIPEACSLAASAHGSYGVNWAPDSATVIVLEERKWGVEGAYWVRIHGGEATEPFDLASEVRKELLPYYKESGAPSYNDSIDFVFDSGEFNTWSPRNDGRVTIDCVCASDPREHELDEGRWTMRFRGTWDMNSWRFTDKSARRMNRQHPEG